MIPIYFLDTLCLINDEPEMNTTAKISQTAK